MQYRKRPRIAVEGRMYISWIARCRSGAGSGPVMRQEFGDPVNGIAANTGADVFEPGERIYVDALAGTYETAKLRRTVAVFSADVTAENRAWNECGA